MGSEKRLKDTVKIGIVFHIYVKAVYDQYRHYMAEWKGVNGRVILYSLEMEPYFCIYVHLGGKKMVRKNTYFVRR